MKNNLRNQKAITLISLIITIIILLILTGITITALTGENQILEKSQHASDETNKQTATEMINLKITNIEISTYSKKQQMPSLQELADGLCEDEADEIEYVVTKNPNEANIEKIEIGTAKSIFTKLKDYPYVFEIDSSLRLASIDNVRIPSSDDDKIADSSENHIIFSNGLKMCWGKVTVGINNMATVKLPIEFSNDNYNIIVNHNSRGSAYHYFMPSAMSSDNSTISVSLYETHVNASSREKEFLLNYICIGY